MQDIEVVDTERALASIRKIKNLLPIPGADSIELAQIDGWECVVKKGEFKVGDLSVYFEIDSLLPPKPEFQFLEIKKYRIKTIRLRGQISQGLALPISSISYVDLSSVKEGDNVTDLLGIKKYEVAIRGQKNAFLGCPSGVFPTSIIRKTDEPRIQNCVQFLYDYEGVEFYYAEKLDGSSFTAYLKYDHFGVCSRNYEIKEGEFEVGAFIEVSRKLGLEEKFRKLNRSIALQGELIGSQVQGNKYNLSERTVKIFSGWDIECQKYLDLDELEAVTKDMGLEMVPVLGKNMPLKFTVKELIAMSIGKSVMGDTEREGLVFRPMKEMIHKRLGRVSFKVINPEFLLKYNL